MKSQKQIQRQRRGARVRAKISGTNDRPRLVVFRSLRKVEVQLVDDQKGITLFAVTSHGDKKPSSVESAKKVGSAIAQQATKGGITHCVFDRNGYRYHGRVKAVAEGAREAGLQF